MSLDPRTFIALLSAVIIWSSAFTGIEIALTAYTPSEAAALRYLVASLALTVIWAWRGARLPNLRDVPALVLLGGSGVTVYNLALNAGQTTITAGAASLLIATVPVFTAAIAHGVLAERLSVRGWLGLVVAFIGAGFVALGEGGGLMGGVSFGALLVILAALSGALYFVLQKPYLQRYPALDTTTWMIWGGTLLLVPFAPSGLMKLPGAPLAPTAALVFMGVFPSAIGYALWTYGLSRARAGIVASLLFMQPVFGVGLAFLILGELPHPLAIAGGVLGLTGVAMVLARSRTVKALATVKPTQPGRIV